MTQTQPVITIPRAKDATNPTARVTVNVALAVETYQKLSAMANAAGITRGALIALMLPHFKVEEPMGGAR